MHPVSNAGWGGYQIKYTPSPPPPPSLTPQPGHHGNERHTHLEPVASRRLSYERELPSVKLTVLPSGSTLLAWGGEGRGGEEEEEEGRREGRGGEGRGGEGRGREGTGLALTPSGIGSS